MKDHWIIGTKRGRETSSTFFGKVEAIKSGIVYGHIAKDSHIKERRSGFEIPTKDVLIDLGPNPAPGSVYGHDVTSRFQGNKFHDFFGQVAWFYKPTPELAKKLMSAFDEAAKILNKFQVPAPTDSVWEIRGPQVKGKWAGYYKHSPQPEKNPHRFSIKPESVPVTELTYVVLHEFAHHLHRQFVTGTKINASWVRLFNTSIRQQPIPSEVSKRFLDDILRGEENLSAYRSGLDEDDRNQFNWVVRDITKRSGVSLRELDLLFDAGDSFRKDLAKLWTKDSLRVKDLKPIISEYATTNYHETFAEAVAFHLCKRKLPEDVVSLIEKSLSYARANS